MREQAGNEVKKGGRRGRLPPREEREAPTVKLTRETMFRTTLPISYVGLSFR